MSQANFLKKYALKAQNIQGELLLIWLLWLNIFFSLNIIHSCWGINSMLPQLQQNNSKIRFSLLFVTHFPDGLCRIICMFSPGVTFNRNFQYTSGIYPTESYRWTRSNRSYQSMIIYFRFQLQCLMGFGCGTYVAFLRKILQSYQGLS